MPSAKSPTDIVPLTIERPSPGQMHIHLIGNWRSLGPLYDDHLQRAYEQVSQAEHLSFDASALEKWDSRLLVFLRTLIAQAQSKNIDVDLSGLPNGVRRLLALASGSPPQADRRRPSYKNDPLHRLGAAAIALWLDLTGTLRFVGEVALSGARILSGRGKFNFKDLWPLVQECGPSALPIITLVSFLVGTILAYMGAVQLQQFGAQIYIADLVALGMTREMGAIMTGIVVSGRSGAAFAAQLGTMQVNEEVDAFKTLGISPIDYLVLPRMMALVVMVPLLTVYSVIMGILGGMVVTVSLMDLHVFQYFYQTLDALTIADFLAGLIKSAIYGVLIAIAGCMRGMQCGRSAQAVGLATTSAVVTSIVFMVIAAAFLAVVFHEIGL